eukprot:1190374-Prorocentrum_minimum.AAC.1
MLHGMGGLHAGRLSEARAGLAAAAAGGVLLFAGGMRGGEAGPSATADMYYAAGAPLTDRHNRHVPSPGCEFPSSGCEFPSPGCECRTAVGNA